MSIFDWIGLVGLSFMGVTWLGVRFCEFLADVRRAAGKHDRR